MRDPIKRAAWRKAYVEKNKERINQRRRECYSAEGSRSRASLRKYRGEHVKLAVVRARGIGLVKSTLTLDHVRPISKGGPHTYANIVAACGPCNSSKHVYDAPRSKRRPFANV